MNGLRRCGTYIHNRILLRHEKNEKLTFAATQMDPEITILTEVTQRETKSAMSLRWGNTKRIHWRYHQKRNRPPDVENTLMATKGEKEVGRDKIGLWE